jgi:hypothetical protein
VIAWNRVFRRRQLIRLRPPQSMTLVTGSDRESISAVYDAGGRLVHLTVHTRLRSLRER